MWQFGGPTETNRDKESRLAWPTENTELNQDTVNDKLFKSEIFIWQCYIGHILGVQCRSMIVS